MTGHLMSWTWLYLVGCVLACGVLAGCQPDGQRIDYHGWDAVRLDNGIVQVTVVPDVARIMAFGRANGPSLIWQDASLWGKTAPLTNLDFQNYGGAKLWVAPQDAWGWPPVPAMDRGACATHIAPDGAIEMRGLSCSVTGVRLDRSIALGQESAVLHLQYTMQNTTTSNVSWGIWNVIQLEGGGRVLLPVPEGTRVWEHQAWSILDAWKRCGDVLVLQHSGKEGKVHTIGPEGWIAYEKDGEVFVLAFPAAPGAVYPSAHGNCEVYAGGQYVELEHVAPLTELAPGDTTTTTECWLSFSLEAAVLSDFALAALVRDRVLALK